MKTTRSCWWRWIAREWFHSADTRCVKLITVLIYVLYIEVEVNHLRLPMTMDHTNDSVQWVHIMWMIPCSWYTLRALNYRFDSTIIHWCQSFEAADDDESHVHNSIQLVRRNQLDKSINNTNEWARLEAADDDRPHLNIFIKLVHIFNSQLYSDSP